MASARFRGFFYFLLTVAAVLLVLKVLDWLPPAIQKDTIRPYTSVDEVRSKLNMKELRVPSYFPQTITWPPAQILAQSKPFPAMLLIFNHAGKQEPALIISQAESDAFPGKSSLFPMQIKEKVAYRLRDRKALLEVGTCGGEQPCSRLGWTEGNLRITLNMQSTPFELLKIAESMLH